MGRSHGSESVSWVGLMGRGQSHGSGSISLVSLRGRGQSPGVMGLYDLSKKVKKIFPSMSDDFLLRLRLERKANLINKESLNGNMR